VARTLHASQGSSGRRSVIAGYVWKLIRESVNLTQLQFAAELDLDVSTIQGWESGRRPLTAVSSGDLARLRINLIRRGAHPRLFAVLNDAIEADGVIDYAVGHGGRLGDARYHPLAATVHQRHLTNLITWPLTNETPRQLLDLVQLRRPRRGPVPGGPVLSADERSRLFAHLFIAADAPPVDEHRLLRRQAIYLLAFDQASDTKQWLADEHSRALGTARRMNDVLSWVSVRSAAIALAQAGDQEALSRFVTHGLADPDQTIANLNYWAYWMGETGEVYTDDGFMRQPGVSWHGTQLLDHLVDRLSPRTIQSELYVPTLWQLLLARPSLLDRRPQLRVRALVRVGDALDDQSLPTRLRQQLSDIAYAIKLSDA
jgi:transcriptional regulator with XRE-family HTH domain